MTHPRNKIFGRNRIVQEEQLSENILLLVVVVAVVVVIVVVVVRTIENINMSYAHRVGTVTVNTVWSGVADIFL